MSDTVNHSAAPAARPLPPGVEMQDNEDIGWGGLGLLAAMALVIFALGISFSIFVLKDAQNGNMTQRENPTAPILDGCREDPLKCAQVGIVEQRQIPIEQRARDAKKKGQQRLLEYGWADQSAQQVHIPVAAGMQKVVNGERP
jgi:hypothetical protein